MTYAIFWCNYLWDYCFDLLNTPDHHKIGMENRVVALAQWKCFVLHAQPTPGLNLGGSKYRLSSFWFSSGEVVSTYRVVLSVVWAELWKLF